jgi:electron transport complex protein RnfD
MQLFTVSGSPHVHNNQSVEKIMWGVVVAMIPALLVSLWYFGLAALITTAIAVLSCVVLEYAITKYVLKEQPSITDGSAVVTGILLAFNVPSSIPWWQLVIGSMVAIGVAKMSFGGLGRNPFNPALVGRVFMLISFPVDMTLWPLPIQNRFLLTDAITGPTSLGIVKEGVKNGETLTQLASQVPDYTSMFMGGIGGSLGEVSAAALIIGGIYMLYKKIITWHIPVSYLFTVFIFTGLLWLINPEQYIDPVFHLLAGGLMLGAIYMATDMATSPMTSKGMLVYGLGCGVLTVLIRVWGAYPEGVSFAILIMNAVTPLINKGFKPARFGEVVKA